MKDSLIVLVLCILLAVSPLYAGTYLDSAHGNNSTYGVKRTATGFPTDYARGNCAHCHEQHASIGGAEPNPTGGPHKYLLFDTNYTDQTTNFCYHCHGSTYQTGGIPIPWNYSYSYLFGGNTTAGTYDTSILSAFSHTASGSSHWLENIKSFALGTTRYTATGAPWLLNNNLNPCDACHNPHIAKRNYNSPYDATKSAISRPSDHGNLWGDDSTERMNNYLYKSPYWNSTSTYEPAGDGTSNGSNQPDYTEFCTDCHNPNNTINSTNPRLPNQPRSLTKINWSSTGDRHGGKSGSANKLRAPYSSGYNYVLSCLDCHEPHGSSNIYLMRTEVNLATSIAFTSTLDARYQELCDACHNRSHSSGCVSCHKHGGTF